MFYYDFSLEPVKYDLWVGGKQVTEINQNDILGDGKASFNPSTNTLTLNNLNGTIGLVADTYENTCAIYSKGIDNLTITGTADLSKNTGDFAIEALSGNITFKNADLKLKGKAVAIKADKITFDGGTIDAESAADSEGGAAIAANDIILNKGTVKTSIDGQLVDGIHVKTMTVNGGLLDVKSNGASCTGICVENSLTLNSGEINANAYDMDDYAYGLTGKYGGSTKLTVKGGKLYSYGSYAGVINFDGGITLAKGIGITKPADGKLDDGKTKVVNKDGVIPSEVEISAGSVTYTVTFDLNGKPGTPPETQIIEKGGKVTKPSDPDVLAATFTGWYTDKACKKAYDFDTPVTKDFTLYAGWKEIKKYTVTFSANGKTATNMPDPQEVEEGEYVKMPLSDPKAEGFTFGGWYKEASCKNLFDSSTPIKSDTTIYAKWIAESTETFTVTFDLNGKGMGIPAPQKVEKGKKAKKPTDPEAEGFTFTGWYTESACKNKYNFGTAVTADITLYAGWEEVEPVPLPDPIAGGSSALDSVPEIIPGKTSDLYLVKGQKFNIGQGWYIDKTDKASKKLVSISKKGVFTAKAVGDAVIKCGAGETATQLTVHISKPKMEKKSLKLELTAEDAFRTEQINLSYDSANLKVLWHSANPDVVTVDNTGKVTTVGKGSSKVTAYINGSAYTCKVTVKEKVGLLDHTVHLAKGASKTISIKGLKKPVWEVSKDGIVTIKKNKITGTAAGRTVLSYTQDDKTYRVTVIVEDIALSGEGLKEQGKAGSNKYTIDSLKVGDDTDLFFKDVDQSVVFKSSKPDIAFIDENQNVVIRGTGKAKFTAKVDGKSITINVTVK